MLVIMTTNVYSTPVRKIPKLVSVKRGTERANIVGTAIQRRTCPYFEAFGCFGDVMEKICGGDYSPLLSENDESAYRCCCKTPYKECEDEDKDQQCLKAVKKHIGKNVQLLKRVKETEDNKPDTPDQTISRLLHVSPKLQKWNPPGDLWSIMGKPPKLQKRDHLASLSSSVNLQTLSKPEKSHILPTMVDVTDSAATSLNGVGSSVETPNLSNVAPVGSATSSHKTWKSWKSWFASFIGINEAVSPPAITLNIKSQSPPPIDQKLLKNAMDAVS